jgi:kynurenine formamidase
MNFITPEVVQETARLVRTGKSFSLGVNFDSAGPQGTTAPFRTNPIHLMTIDGGDAAMFAEHVRGWGHTVAAALGTMFDNGLMRFNDDYIIMPLQAATQWDALSHVYYEDQLFNGYPADSVTSFGATRLGIETVGYRGIVARGVLLDVARSRGVPYLDPGAPISPEELEDVAARQGTEIRPGDVLLIRTGWWERFLETRDGAAHGSGLSWRCAAWLHEHEIAAVAADNVAVEGADAEVDGVFLALHCLCLRDMGMMFGEMWDLSALSADCASDGVYECQLVAQPLRVTGGVGSPVNPIAIK